jgi:hypothetical protein
MRLIEMQICTLAFGNSATLDPTAAQILKSECDTETRHGGAGVNIGIF